MQTKEHLPEALAAEGTAAPEQTESPQEDAPADSPAPASGTLRDVLDAQPVPDLPADTPAQHIRTRDVFVGVLLVLLAAVGVYAIVLRCIAWAGQIRDDTPDTAAVRSCILPLAVMDCASFDAPEMLTDTQFLTAAAWAMITDGRLESEEGDLCTVPASELIAYGNARFGTSRKPICSTIAFTKEIRFYYDPAQDAFLLPAEPQFFSFLPEIRAVRTAEGGRCEVEADYLLDRPDWMTGTASVVKTVTLTLVQDGDGWQIAALHDPTAPVTEPPAETTTETTTTTTETTTTTTSAETTETTAETTTALSTGWGW